MEENGARLEMTANNLKQALLPQGARLLYNDFGTAPGIWLKHQDKIIILLPGPPREMEPMFTEIVLPFLPATGSVCFPYSESNRNR